MPSVPDPTDVPSSSSAQHDSVSALNSVNAEHSPAAPRGWRNLLANFALPLLLLAVATGVGVTLIKSPPHVPRAEPETLAPVVGTANLVPKNESVFVKAFGNVIPSRAIDVIPEVNGRVIELHDHMEPGGIIGTGETLVKIDPIDYEINVAQWEAELEVARNEAERLQANVEASKGRGEQLDVEIAYLQWNSDRLSRLAEQAQAAQSEARDARTQLDSRKAERDTLNSEIAAQEKAVDTARARIRVAERQLESARLALERTEIKAPFDAIVMMENVETGQLVGSQSMIARLAATDEFWAEAAIPVARLKDVRFKLENENDPSDVSIRLAAGGATSIERHGVALRPLGNLDPLGRMARVVVSIEDPLGLKMRETKVARRVLLGSYVRVQIESTQLNDVYSIPRKALRENDRVWVRDAEGELAIRPVQIVWRRQDDVLVRNAFQPGDDLVTTHLSSVVPGMPLRIRAATTPVLADENANTNDDEPGSIAVDDGSANADNSQLDDGAIATTEALTGAADAEVTQ